jgi:hypothetical protein
MTETEFLAMATADYDSWVAKNLALGVPADQLTLNHYYAVMV